MGRDGRRRGSRSSVGGCSDTAIDNAESINRPSRNLSDPGQGEDARGTFAGWPNELTNLGAPF